MIQSKYKNPLREFITHGLKTSGNYQYVLKIDMIGQTIIQKVKSDNTEILFTKKDNETSIEDFWADPTAHSYVYFYQL